MAFHAQIFQALAFNKGDSKEIRKKLNRMLRDDKHIDHFDMLHYALADLDLKERQGLCGRSTHLMTSAQGEHHGHQTESEDLPEIGRHLLRRPGILRCPAVLRLHPDRSWPRRTSALEEVKTRARVLGELVEQLAIIAIGG